MADQPISTSGAGSFIPTFGAAGSTPTSGADGSTPINPYGVSDLISDIQMAVPEGSASASSEPVASSEAEAPVTVNNHIAPAGEHYDSILDAGREQLKQNFAGFLQGMHSAVIPPIFVNKCLDAGMNPERKGEDAEFDTYNALSKLAGNSQMLVLRGLEIPVVKHCLQRVRPWGRNVASSRVYAAFNGLT